MVWILVQSPLNKLGNLHDLSSQGVHYRRTSRMSVFMNYSHFRNLMIHTTQQFVEDQTMSTPSAKNVSELARLKD
jgi:hypothetical protein